MRLAQFINDHLLAKLNLRLVRVSTLRQQDENAAALRQSLARTRQQLSAFDERLDRLTGHDDETQRERIEQLHRQTERRLAGPDRSLADLGRSTTSRVDQQQRLILKISSSDEAQAQFLKLARFFSPRAAVGHRKVRLGRQNDGGYVMLEDFEGVGAAFSFGIGDDSSWDLDVANRGIATYQFDHTIASAPASHPNLHFYSRKILPKPHEDGETIAGLLERHGGGPGARNLLKMDIEGDEWPILEHAELDHLQRFTQIVCEFHNFSHAAHPSWCARATAVMDKLSQAFQVVHVHGNNTLSLVCIGNVPFPEVLEVTLANRECYQFEDTDQSFPTLLDQPNSIGSADLYLGRFKF